MLPINPSRTCSLGPNFQSVLLFFSPTKSRCYLSVLIVFVCLFVCFFPNQLSRFSRIFYSSFPSFSSALSMQDSARGQRTGVPYQLYLSCLQSVTAVMWMKAVQTSRWYKLRENSCKLLGCSERVPEKFWGFLGRSSRLRNRLKVNTCIAYNGFLFQNRFFSFWVMSFLILFYW